MMNDRAECEDIERTEVHERQISLRGFRRSDGQFEVEARLIDRKTHPLTLPGAGRVVAAGDAVHDMSVTVVFDGDLTVTAIDAVFGDYPHPQCPGGAEPLANMVGARIGKGWSRTVRERLPAPDTCTHIRELLIPLASAAYQTALGSRAADRGKDGFGSRSERIDSCYAYGRDRALVASLWPEPDAQDR